MAKNFGLAVDVISVTRSERVPHYNLDGAVAAFR
jgi:hypothetical protein